MAGVITSAVFLSKTVDNLKKLSDEFTENGCSNGSDTNICYDNGDKRNYQYKILSICIISLVISSGLFMDGVYKIVKTR